VIAGLAGAWSVHSKAERDCLVSYADGCHTIVELGVLQGASTKLLRQAMASGGTLYAVDRFSPGGSESISPVESPKSKWPAFETEP